MADPRQAIIAPILRTRRCFYKKGDRIGNYIVVKAVLDANGMCSKIHLVEDNMARPLSIDELRFYEHLGNEDFTSPHGVGGKIISYSEALLMDVNDTSVSSAAAVPNIRRRNSWTVKNYIQYKKLQNMGIAPPLNTAAASSAAASSAAPSSARPWENFGMTEQEYKSQLKAQRAFEADARTASSAVKGNARTASSAVKRNAATKAAAEAATAATIAAASQSPEEEEVRAEALRVYGEPDDPWITLYDNTYNRVFYSNPVTNETTWIFRDTMSEEDKELEVAVIDSAPRPPAPWLTKYHIVEKRIYYVNPVTRKSVYTIEETTRGGGQRKRKTRRNRIRGRK